jgi:hypothetical protein
MVTVRSRSAILIGKNDWTLFLRRRGGWCCGRDFGRQPQRRDPVLPQAAQADFRWPRRWTPELMAGEIEVGDSYFDGPRKAKLMIAGNPIRRGASPKLSGVQQAPFRDLPSPTVGKTEGITMRN